MSETVNQLIKYLCTQSGSPNLRYLVKRGISADQQAKDMLSRYKTSAEMRRHYAEDSVTREIFAALEKREKNHQDINGWISEARSLMERNPGHFSKVCSGEYLEVEVSSCNSADKLKSTLDKLKSERAVTNYLLNRKDEGKQYHIVHLGDNIRGFFEKLEREEKQCIAQFCKSMMTPLKENPTRAVEKSAHKSGEKIVLEVVKKVHKESQDKKLNYWQMFYEYLGKESRIESILQQLYLSDELRSYLSMHKVLLTKTMINEMYAFTQEEIARYKNTSGSITAKPGVKLPNSSLMDKLAKLLVDVRFLVHDPTIKFVVSEGQRDLHGQCKLMVENKISKGAKDFHIEYINADGDFKKVLEKYNTLAKQTKLSDSENLAKKMEEELSQFSQTTQEKVFQHIQGSAFDLSYTDLISICGKPNTDIIIKYVTDADRYNLHCYFHGGLGNEHFHFSLR